MVIAMLGLNQIAVYQSKNALIEAEKHVIEGIREARRQRVESYFEVINDQMINFANNLMVRQATAELATAFDSIDASSSELSAHSQALAQYFDREFRPRLNDAEQPYRGAASYTPSSVQGRVLLDWYLASNPHAVGEKLELARAASDVDYNRLHAVYHPVVRQYLESFGYYDIFLFDTQGNMVYSVFKETDYATNFVSGPYRDTGLGQVFREAVELPEGSVAIRDFASYEPSYGAAASFIASPVYYDGECVGVAAFQMPVDRINSIATNEAGLGEHGTSYLVGFDGMLRSNTRFDDSALLSRKIDDEWLSDATHQSGEFTGIGIAGNEAIIEYAPLELAGLDWVVVIEVDKGEITAPAKALAWQMLFGVIVLVAVIALALSFAIRSAISPIRLLITSVRDMAEGEGDLTQRMDEARKDELGELAHWLNRFVGKIHDVIVDSALVSRDLAGASKQVAVAAEEMARGMDDQRGQVTTVSAAIEEMSATVMEVARQASDANETAGQAGQQASEGGQIVNQTVDAMTSIASVVNHASEAVSALGDRADQIGAVIDVINDIADQTNLLALNAAIEAARAGEHGRGFAVVADEVRKLAERTSQATDEVSESIKAIQGEAESTVTRMSTGTERVNAGVACAHEAGEALQMIVEGSSGVASLIQGIASSTEQQSQASDDIARSVEQITAVSRQSAEGASQMAQAADQMARKSDELDRLIAQFKVDQVVCQGISCEDEG